MMEINKKRIILAGLIAAIPVAIGIVQFFYRPKWLDIAVTVCGFLLFWLILTIGMYAALKVYKDIRSEEDEHKRHSNH